MLYHLDLYRLAEGPAAAHAVELEELLADERAVIVIEWAERMGNYRLPVDGLARLASKATARSRAASPS